MKSKWETKKLKDVCTVVTDGVHKTPKYQDSGVRFISIKNIAPFEDIKWDSYVRFVSESEHKELSKRANVQKDDILFPRIGTLGFAKRVDFDDPVSIFVGLGLAKPNKSIIFPRFLEYWMNSPYVYKYSHEKATGAGRQTLALRDSREMPVPVPPLTEQKRIVKILDELLGKTSKLETLYHDKLVNLEELEKSLLSKFFV